MYVGMGGRRHADGVGSDVTEQEPCKGCGKVGERVRPCCAWEGWVMACDACRMSGDGKTRWHVCGVGMQRPKFIKGEGDAE